MDNVAERIGFVEVLERLARLRRFLLAEQKSGDRAARDVVSVFNWAVAGILKSLDPVAAILATNSPLNENDQIACGRKLANAYSYFDEMHLRLSHIRGDWVSPEVHVFLRKILEFVPPIRRPKDISVILLNEYSFESEDLASHARMLLASESVTLDSVPDRPSVSLPKVERDNPLYWADLVHECGHIDKEGVDELLDDQELMQAATTPEKARILGHWAEEFYCDLFATKILGPAYLASFAASALISAGLDGGEHGSDTHPPNIVRICLMRRMLDKNSLDIPLSGDLKEFGSLANLFYLANEERNRVERLHLASQPPTEAPELGHIPLTEFADRIIEIIDDAVQHERELKAADFERTPQLARRLTEGILIGSYPNDEALAEIRRRHPSSKNADEGMTPDLSRDFSLAKAAIQESYTLPWEIINAGWLHKVETLYPFAFSLFFTGSNRELTGRIEEFDRRLMATDEVLLKSIEVSQIHNMFGVQQE